MEGGGGEGAICDGVVTNICSEQNYTHLLVYACFFFMWVDASVKCDMPKHERANSLFGKARI